MGNDKRISKAEKLWLCPQISQLYFLGAITTFERNRMAEIIKVGNGTAFNEVVQKVKKKDGISPEAVRILSSISIN